MKIRLADYVADYLADKGISNCFTVTGGGAMHLNDAFGHHSKIKCLYNHHEQGSAIAAECYARITNKPAVLCVTTGPGGTNALTGVVGAWLDSIPMIVISGQVRYDTTARYNETLMNGLKLRSVGDQEYDIVRSVEPMTKYAVMLENPLDIKMVLDKAYKLATTGRPGPTWIDIPVNFQGAIIDTNNLKSEETLEDKINISPSVVGEIISRISKAKRPVIYAGNGIRLAGAFDAFQRVVVKLNVPVVTYWDSIDLMETDNRLYVGRAGNMGDRPGNFAVQNSDFILAIGNRLSIRNVGYNWDTWAREAYVCMVDIDEAELNKPTIHVDMKVRCDARILLEKMDESLDKEPLFKNQEWLDICSNWKEKYPVVGDKQREDIDGLLNPYNVLDYVSRRLPEGSITVTSNGTCCVAGHQSWYINKGDRFINNNAVASMGYGLPAAIGASVAAPGKDIICLEGDGSIMMNLQELQTLVTNNLPVKILLINNEGYHSIRQTQNNLFGEHTKVGIGPESNDLSFPDFGKLIPAFGIEYMSASNTSELEINTDRFLAYKGPVVLEAFVSPKQVFEPKASTRKLEDGSLVSAPLEDLAPFLSREELASNMYVKPAE